MIVGVGLDLVEVARVKALLERQHDAFLDRILHGNETRARERAHKPEGPAHVAGLFAAKEAVMKALGTGMAGAAFRDIEVRHDDGGRPGVAVHGDALRKSEAAGVGSWHLSITHSRTTAAAVAIAYAYGVR